MTIFKTIVKSLATVASIIILLVIVLLFFSLFFYLQYSDIQSLESKFNTIDSTIFTLIQILTLDDWFEIYTTVTSSDDVSEMCGTSLVVGLVVYIIVGYFIVLNLFIAVLVDNFQQINQQSEAREAVHKNFELEEATLVQKVEGNMSEISDDNLRARLVRLNSLIGEEESDMLSDDYESSEEEMTNDEIKQQVLKNIREGGERDKNGKVEEKSNDEVNTLLWYHRILASLEKHLGIANDQIITHDRVISLLADDPEEIMMI